MLSLSTGTYIGSTYRSHVYSVVMTTLSIRNLIPRYDVDVQCCAIFDLHFLFLIRCNMSLYASCPFSEPLRLVDVPSYTDVIHVEGVLCMYAEVLWCLRMMCCCRIQLNRHYRLVLFNVTLIRSNCSASDPHMIAYLFSDHCNAVLHRLVPRLLNIIQVLLLLLHQVQLLSLPHIDRTVTLNRVNSTLQHSTSSCGSSTPSSCQLYTDATAYSEYQSTLPNPSIVLLQLILNLHQHYFTQVRFNC
jgi:hypothetical protein